MKNTQLQRYTITFTYYNHNRTITICTNDIFQQFLIPLNPSGDHHMFVFVQPHPRIGLRQSCASSHEQEFGQTKNRLCHSRGHGTITTLGGAEDSQRYREFVTRQQMNQLHQLGGTLTQWCGQVMLQCVTNLIATDYIYQRSS